MRIGFMQGRLVEMVEGQIQAFPWSEWEREFEVAQHHGFDLMEWTLDAERILDNPLMCQDGRNQIGRLCSKHGVDISSLTGDFFMQSPFFKVNGELRAERIKILHLVIDACDQLGIRLIVLPLVDHGSIGNLDEENLLVRTLLDLDNLLSRRNMKIIFESDYDPIKLGEFIARFPVSTFGINYDVGNSAALGYVPSSEFENYGSRIFNVHIKDRLLGGTTVPLGKGNADFDAVFRLLRKVQYSGNFILQTARASDGDHALALSRYRDMVNGWWNINGSQAYR